MPYKKTFLRNYSNSFILYCNQCGLYKYRKDFRIKNGYIIAKCIDCENINRKKTFDKDKAKISNRKSVWKKRNIDITYDSYLNMLTKQNSKCAICGVVSEHLSVDHCHKTNNIRGLLCNTCNLGLGSFKDSIEFLSKAQQYLLDYK